MRFKQWWTKHEADVRFGDFLGALFFAILAIFLAVHLLRERPSTVTPAERPKAEGGRCRLEAKPRAVPACVDDMKAQSQ
ncbi:MAG TPA: hypothetical protein VGC51_13200 [Hansschlegelia sp.]